MAPNTPYVTLNDGNKMPQVGFGLWKVDNATCADTVYNAIKAGYRLFDGACGMYISIPLLAPVDMTAASLPIYRWHSASTFARRWLGMLASFLSIAQDKP